MKIKSMVLGREQPVTIEYRTIGPNSEDMLCGYCRYDPENKQLVPLDHDDYSLEDEITRYEWISPNQLTIWYTSRWITK